MPECLCWVGHGSCGGCSGYPGIIHEPACGWEWDPDCPVHPPLTPSGEWRPYDDVPSSDLPGMWERSDFIDDRDDYYASVPEGYHVVEDLDGERLVLNEPIQVTNLPEEHRGPHVLLHKPTGETATCGGPGVCRVCDNDPSPSMIERLGPDSEAMTALLGSSQTRADLALVIDNMEISTEDALTGEKTTEPLPEFIKNRMREAAGLPQVTCHDHSVGEP